MLHALELENFKAFGKRARIPFAPITLIFGENSAGKSTILQALNLLKQTHENREAGDLLLTRADNVIVDLGNFQEMLFDHDLKRTLSIRVESTVGDSIFRLPYKGGKIAIEFRFTRTSVDADVLLDQVSIYDGESSKCLAKFQPLNTTENPEDFSGSLAFFPNSRGVSRSKLTVLKCIWLTAEPEYWESEFEWCKENKEKIIQGFKEKLTELENSDEAHLEDDNMLQEKLKSLLENDIRFLSSDFDLKSYISNRHQEEINTVLRVQGLLPVAIRLGRKHPQMETSYSLLEGRSEVRETFNGAELVIMAYDGLQGILEMLFPMGPFRKPPERWYTFRGTSPQHVGYQGDLLPDLLLRHPELVEGTNEWLKRLDIGYKLEVKSIGDDSGDLFAVRLIDTRRKEQVSVALPDVGYGISQLLPFVVQSLVSEQQIISIEQPEVHVHPRLQADLGDLLAEAIKEPRQNQFIIETHSEHLILRLQRLVYERRIKPEDVSVIYVSRGPEGAETQRLHLDGEGDFVDEWPDGFFPERLRELR